LISSRASSSDSTNTTKRSTAGDDAFDDVALTSRSLRASMSSTAWSLDSVSVQESTVVYRTSSCVLFDQVIREVDMVLDDEGDEHARDVVIGAALGHARLDDGAEGRRQLVGRVETTEARQFVEHRAEHGARVHPLRG